MTIPELEWCVCSSLLDAPTGKPGPNTCTALAFVECWESPEAIQVARGIRKAIEAGRPTHRVVVGLFMDAEYRYWLKHPIFNDPLPLSCLESAVEPALEHYRDKQLVGLLGKAYGQAHDHPDTARQVATDLKVELEKVL